MSEVPLYTLEKHVNRYDAPQRRGEAPPRRSLELERALRESLHRERQQVTSPSTRDNRLRVRNQLGQSQGYHLGCGAEGFGRVVLPPRLLLRALALGERLHNRRQSNLVMALIKSSHSPNQS